jgi:hypothetical protein
MHIHLLFWIVILFSMELSLALFLWWAVCICRSNNIDVFQSTDYVRVLYTKRKAQFGINVAKALIVKYIWLI